MRRLAAIGLVAALACAIAATAFAAIVARPDGEIKRKGKNYKGAEVINNSGEDQTAGAKVKQGGKAIFIIRYRNTSLTDTQGDFTIGGCEPPPEFLTSYQAQGDNVTDEVNDGTLIFENIDVGDYTPKLKVKAKVAGDAVDGFSTDVCVPAVADGGLRDEPSWKVKVK